MPRAHFRNSLSILFAVGLFAMTSAPARCFADEKVDFQRQVRPILSNHCFQCHGPDAESREAGLRLDERASAVKTMESGVTAIVPGDVGKSELISRIFSHDESAKMPPDEAKRPLSDEQKEILKTWVAQGAVYDGLWSFVAPLRSGLPAVQSASQERNAIDRFINAKLEAEGVVANGEADKAALLRRVTLDLTGLPPTLEEIEAFTNDQRPGAYERVVERLLASPRFGERMAMDWLDAARFADTNGYHIDNGRDMTRWREWVIDSFNRNMPIDQFYVEQIAGDLLPNPTLSQKIASGFNRNHMINFEGGAVPEEYHNAYIVDRVNTTSTVFLGLTVGCAQCHDHKYDPISQKDFYRLYAFFYNVPERGLDGNQGNAAPFIRAPRDGDAERLAELSKEVDALRARFTEPDPALDAEQAGWEATALEKETTVDWRHGEVVSVASRRGSTWRAQPDGLIEFTGANPAQDIYSVTIKSDLSQVRGVRIEMLPDNRLAGSGPGRSVNGNVVFTNLDISTGATEEGVELEKRKIVSGKTAWHQENFPIEKVFDADSNSGWALLPKTGEAHELRFALEPAQSNASGTIVELHLHFESIFAAHQPGRIRISLTGDEQPLRDASFPAEIAGVLKKAAGDRTAEEQVALRKYFRTNVLKSGAEWQAALAAKEKERTEFEASIPTAMVMEEMAQPRETFVLMRGAYDKKGEKVEASVPSSLPALPEDAPKNRLGLAKWLVSPEQPLTARVTANRVWQSFFGVGIVKSVDDFGSQGELPSHPELLDYLATELTQPEGGVSPWDMKHLVRLMVTSAAYRRSSAMTAEQVAQDPENRLLARGSRFRMTAELIRDQALFAAGLLDGRIGGQSVSPYQPAGIWEELASRSDGKNWTAQEYDQSHGVDLYRRTMYTFWKRTAPPPSLMTFDAPDRETCTVRRARTNTPLQALVLWNDPTYIEASRNMAERFLDGAMDDRSRLARIFTALTGRAPSDAEGVVLLESLQKQREHFSAAPSKATKLVQIGESKSRGLVSDSELAAWTMVCSLIMNLDESLTRG